MTRRAAISKYGRPAATLTETPELSVVFAYDETWRSFESEWVAQALPMTSSVAPVVSPGLPPFLDGLIPEGWLLGLASRVKPGLAKDRFGLLLATCGDAVGAVGVSDPNALVVLGSDGAGPHHAPRHGRGQDVHSQAGASASSDLSRQRACSHDDRPRGGTVDSGFRTDAGPRRQAVIRDPTLRQISAW